MDDTAHYSAQKLYHAYSPRLDKFVKMSFSTKLTENIMHEIFSVHFAENYIFINLSNLSNLEL